MNRKKLLQPIVLLLFFFLLCSTVFKTVQGQSEEDYDQYADIMVFLFPDIIRQTMLDAGITPNAELGGLASYELDGEWCGEVGGFGSGLMQVYHDDQFLFVMTSDEPYSEVDYYINDGGYTTLGEKSYTLDGYEVLTWEFSSAESGELGNTMSYGFIELPTSNGTWFKFYGSENCTNVLGKHLPAMESVIAALLNNLYAYGFMSSAQGAAPVPVVEPPADVVEEEVPVDEALVPEETGITEEEMSADPSMMPTAKEVTDAAMLSAAAGAAAGAGVIIMIRGGRRPAPKLIRSPVDGTLVTPRQAQFEQNQLDAGLTYNPARGGFEYIPQAEKTFTPVRSALQPDLEKITADAKTRRQAIAWKAKTNIRAAYEEDMQRYQIDYHMAMAEAAHWNRALVIYTLVEKGADIAIDTLAVIPGGKVIKEVYGTGKAAIKFMNTAKDRGVTVAILQYGVDKLADDAMSKIPVPFKKNGDGSLVDSLGNALTSDVIKGNPDLGTLQDAWQDGSLADASKVTTPGSVYDGILGEGQSLP